MSQKLEVNPFEFDSRMVEWNLKNNRITQEQLKNYLSTLPDDVSNSESLTIDDEDGGYNGHGSNGVEPLS